MYNKTNLFNYSRRKFLAKGIALTVGVSTGIQSKASEILENPNFKEDYNRAISSIGKEQVSIFMQYYNISSGDFVNFVSSVKSLQSLYGLEMDGVLGPKTIDAFYREVDKMGSFQLPLEIYDLIQSKDILDDYPNHPRKIGNRKIKPGKVPDVYAYKNGYFYGKGVGENIKGYYYNEELFRSLEKSGKLETKKYYNSGNFLELEKYNGKYYLAMYVDGILQVLTYVSPGTNKNRTPENIAYNLGVLDLYHISSSYPEKDGNNNNGGAPMPYAVNVSGAIWIHSGNVNGTGLSHGCIRVPVFYQQRIFNILNSFGSKCFQIKIGNLY